MPGQSPIEHLLAAVGDRDADGAAALFAPDAHALWADGRHAESRDGIRALILDALATTRSMRLEVVRQWHQDDVWIAEITTTYVLRDWLEFQAPRAMVVQDGPDGITEVHIYGANERPLGEHGGPEAEIPIGGRPLLPL